MSMRSRLATAGVAALLVLPGLAACSSAPPAVTPATATPTTGTHLAPSEFAGAMALPGTTVIDVRTPEEFASGHLPNAVNIDIRGAGFATQVLALDKNGTYAVYCHTGNRSGVALQQMASAGFAHAFDLSGGIEAWSSYGGDVVS